jgi:hypothetical protein
MTRVSIEDPYVELVDTGCEVGALTKGTRKETYVARSITGEVIRFWYCDVSVKYFLSNRTETTRYKREAFERLIPDNTFA